MFFLRIVTSIVVLFFCSFTYAQSNQPTPPTQETQQLTSPWSLDTGIRYWLGEGDFKWNLYNIVGDELLSRLTYQGVTTNTAEGFWRPMRTSFRARIKKSGCKALTRIYESTYSGVMSAKAPG